MNDDTGSGDTDNGSDARAGSDASASKRPLVRPWLRQALVVVLIGWTAGLGGVLVGSWLERRTDLPAARPSTLGLAVQPPRQQPLPPMDVAVVATRVGPSVVAIQASGPASGGVSVVSGTGVILTSDGEILTNAHVVEGADEIGVRLVGETEPRSAVVIATEPANDLALLRIDATGLTPATFAAVDDVALGDQVIAIGFALDLDGDPSVTQGIVSATDRSLEVVDGVILTGLLQTDAAISSGNSGGPLVNAVGEVVGINTLVAGFDRDGSEVNGLAFAVANKVVLPAVERMRSGQALVDGFLGVSLVERLDGGSGALVEDVVDDSPAWAAGLRIGDVVIAVDGAPIEGQSALVAVIRRSGTGAEVTIDVVREGERLMLTATLADRPDS